MWHLWPPPVVCGSSAAWFVADMFLELGYGDIVSLVGLSFEGTAKLDATHSPKLDGSPSTQRDPDLEGDKSRTGSSKPTTASAEFLVP